MSLFVSSTSAATRHDVYAIKATPRASIRALGTGCIAIVGAFPWGPAKTLYQPTSVADAKQLFAPPGMSRTGYGYLSLLGKAFPDLRIARVVGSSGGGAVAASATLPASSTTILTVPAKWPGVAGNSITWAVSAPQDGNVNHVDLTFQVTGLSGTTTDVIHNFNASATGAHTVLTPDQLNQLQLVGQPVVTNNGVPDTGTGTFSTGADGTIVAADYVGTAGAGDKGIALLEADRAVRHFCVDYPGSSLLASVNAGMVAHRVLMGDRFAYLSGIPGQSLSTAQTDAATYSSAAGVEYIDPWVWIYDDTSGAMQLVPGTTFAASVAAQLPPSTSPAWKSKEVQAMLAGIVKLEQTRGLGAATNTANGLWTFIKEVTGGFTFEAAVNTIAAADPTQARYTVTAMDIYIATAFVQSVRGSVDAPNVPVNQDDLRTALDGFMSALKNAQNNDPNHNAHVVDYAIPSMASANAAADIAAGNVFVQLQVQYSTGMERIFLIMQSGNGPITVTTQQTAPGS